jgi:hypothetical protein
MRMTELMPRKPAPLITQNSGATGSPSRTALDGSSCSQAHSSIPTRGAGRRCRGTSTDPATAIQTGLGEGKRLVDAKARAMTRRSARAAVVGADRRGGARDRDNLLDRRRIGGITHTLVAWRTSCTESGHRRRRAATTSSIEQQLGHDAPSGSRTKLGSTHLRVAASNREECAAPAPVAATARGSDVTCAALRRSMEATAVIPRDRPGSLIRAPTAYRVATPLVSPGGARIQDGRATPSEFAPRTFGVPFS